MPWFRVYLRGVDQGRSWFATNEGEVLQTFVRTKSADLKKEAKKLGLDTAQYLKTGGIGSTHRIAFNFDWVETRLVATQRGKLVAH